MLFVCMSMHTNIFDVTNDAQLDLKQIYFLYDLEFDEIKMTAFDADNDDFTLTLYNLNYGHDYVINVNDTQGDTRNGTQGGTQDRSQKQIFDIAV